MIMTEAHIAALAEAARKPFLGFVAGSNIWPLTMLSVDPPIDGEIIDELLRIGLLATRSLGHTVAGERSPDPEKGPDLEFEHEVFITPTGRARLAEATR